MLVVLTLLLQVQHREPTSPPTQTPFIQSFYFEEKAQAKHTSPAKNHYDRSRYRHRHTIPRTSACSDFAKRQQMELQTIRILHFRAGIGPNPGPPCPGQCGARLSQDEHICMTCLQEQKGRAADYVRANLEEHGDASLSMEQQRAALRMAQRADVVLTFGGVGLARAGTFSATQHESRSNHDIFNERDATSNVISAVQPCAVLVDDLRQRGRSSLARSSRFGCFVGFALFVKKYIRKAGAVQSYWAFSRS
jgi:hypothetical protein